MALNNMTNSPEAVEDHIRKQMEGSGIGQSIAQAILMAQKPMTLTQLAQKHNLEPESAKAFLREWLDAQELQGYIDDNGDLWDANVRVLPEDRPLIARPTDLGD